MTRTALITVAHGRHDHLRRQQEALGAGTVPVDSYRVVAMDDPSLSRWRPTAAPFPLVETVEADAAALPLATARNRGAASALREGAELLIFLDVDCLPEGRLVESYVRAAREPRGRDAVLSGPVAYLPPPPAGGYDLGRLAAMADPHPARPAPPRGTVVRDDDGHTLFWSLSFAVTAETWQRIGGFDERYRGYGAEDTDFGQRARAAGVPIAWVGGARAFHQHHPTSDPPVQHLEDILRNARQFHRIWGWWPMRGWLDAFVERGLLERTDDGAYRRTVDQSAGSVAKSMSSSTRPRKAGSRSV
ncbi:sugar transferase [Aeromicrobium sp. PE09-221]|uniref:glycosyltransferase family 2 protein n=1 Tax=Aeromicrobium sp. PE09-221 TaxID=1898043 RepID=UPI000B3EADE6|nr:galactosyltransferase-related protein [Aeromicrobium sp. PE09-221]OUZ07263.1 sugar transferase [Aeromicrobium sp. PE09-221]